jgi:hypothetical protein
VFVRTVMMVMVFMVMMTVSMMMIVPFVAMVMPVRQYHIEIRTRNSIGRLLRYCIRKLVPKPKGIENTFQLFGTRSERKERANRHIP